MVTATHGLFRYEFREQSEPFTVTRRTLVPCETGSESACPGEGGASGVPSDPLPPPPPQPAIDRSIRKTRKKLLDFIDGHPVWNEIRGVCTPL